MSRSAGAARGDDSRLNYALPLVVATGWWIGAINGEHGHAKWYWFGLALLVTLAALGKLISVHRRRQRHGSAT